ncbi:hypothetical protein B4098_3446 [Heyndrickxia coagulans]|uniref:Uncharacterized protein n=1 Tax=Heyndrickxia coagulans TaxID=1398 RepID=A0A150JVZ6_HEYCO|nr:hypothetical protein B4098_3446 [Heyndrickxia coagulans]
MALRLAAEEGILVGHPGWHQLILLLKWQSVSRSMQEFFV